ncbi:MAG: leucyl/phenylalanyl-tRNA--protein transferase [Pseudomonadota bacterium]
MPRDSATAISTEDLIKAYTLGYFPMAQARESQEIVWVLPKERGVIPLSAARAPRRLKRFLKSSSLEVRINTACHAVICACAEANAGRPETWINDAIIEAYCELHHRGFVHSVECWRGDALVGGLYGVALGGVFCGESMFSRETNASKIAMMHLMARLKVGGFVMIDAQFVNEHLAQFGLTSIPDADYQDLLRDALAIKADFFTAGDQLSAAAVLQSITQAS